MASEQVNLKVAPEVARAWREAAAAAGLSVRDWLIRETLDRPDGLTLEALAARVAALEARELPPAPSVPLGPGVLEIAGAGRMKAPSPDDRPPAAPPDPLDQPLFTAELARRLGRNPKALNHRATKGGLGTVVDGWVVVAQVPAPSGGPLRWAWQRVDD